MDAIQTLEHKLKRAKTSERPHLLQGVYKQLATSHKGRKTRGQFREFVENDSYNGHDFAWAVAEQLDKYGLSNHADRLRTQYNGVPRKPVKEWTEMPNLLGDKDTVEELVSSGDAGIDLANGHNFCSF